MGKCYYEVLGIKNDANHEEVKRAWRKKALELHPDKNPDRADEAHSEFQKAHLAYVILSDPKERSYYDLNRDKVLRQGGRNEIAKWARSCTRIEQIQEYMSESFYKKSQSGKSDFYTVYGDIYEKIEMEEIFSARTDHESIFNDKFDGGLLFKRTTFGTMSTHGSALIDFYTKFLQFQSIKSFSWYDKYYGNENFYQRYERRYIAQEKLKNRTIYRSQYSGLVRDLTNFVKARDPRYTTYLKEIETKRAEIKKDRLESKLQKKKTSNSKNLTSNGIPLEEEAEWTKVDYSKLDIEMAELSIEKDLEELYCSACNKSYRSQKSYENHERSKKHLNNLKVLQEHLVKDEELLQKAKLTPLSPREGNDGE